MAKTIRDNVVALFGKEPDLPPTPLSVDHLFAGDAQLASHEAGIDLAGKPKIVFLIGSGGSGKTTYARWLGERADQRDGVMPPVMVSVDPLNRDLVQYLPDTLQPSKGASPAVVVTYLEKLFLRLLQVKRSAVIDFGGGDTALMALLRQTPGLHTMLEDGGVEAVALHFLSPRVNDLTPLMAFERAGFQPRATALLLNIGRSDPARDAEGSFEHLRRQPDYTKALERGAVEVWIPTLFAAKAVEDRQVGFWRALNNSPGAAEGTPLGMFDKRRVGDWLQKMEECMAPIASWIDL